MQHKNTTNRLNLLPFCGMIQSVAKVQWCPLTRNIQPLNLKRLSGAVKAIADDPAVIAFRNRNSGVEQIHKPVMLGKGVAGFFFGGTAWA